ncbi:CKLF-like MARVEL transmembrane domain-containing protein 5 [Cuculus canorus]|uniref:CKLF-like MARVEL transmembrane domain-containing protein 5 n=1 Tax=Cuculus canorus TaxID=55661 RepID=UPI0023AA6F46|nr:CKLF-like MARVEL transmembrane domain-containing protein 5 [Cuculus canorus]
MGHLWVSLSHLGVPMGHLWVPVGSMGHLGVTYGSLWVTMGSGGHLWVPMGHLEVTSGSLWVTMGSVGHLGVTYGSQWVTWRSLMGPYGSLGGDLWVFVGLYWCCGSLGGHVVPWGSLKGHLWVTVGFMGHLGVIYGSLKGHYGLCGSLGGHLWVAVPPPRCSVGQLWGCWPPPAPPTLAPALLQTLGVAAALGGQLLRPPPRLPHGACLDLLRAVSGAAIFFVTALVSLASSRDALAATTFTFSLVLAFVFAFDAVVTYRAKMAPAVGQDADST